MIYQLPEGILHDHSERIAVLEHGAREAKEVFAEHRREVVDKLDNISATLEKQKGTVGGIVLTVTAIGAVLMICKDWIFSHFQ